jgi:branched-subunit amino acid ABC-type transport system permease component
MHDTGRVLLGTLAFTVLYIAAAFYFGGVSPQFGTIMLLNGLQSASLFVLLALGLAHIFGTMGVVNFAHGAFFALGAYTMWFTVSNLGGSYVVGIVAAVVVTSLAGGVVEVAGLRRIYGENVLIQVIFTFGVALVIQGALTAVFGAGSAGISPPPWGIGTTQLGFVTYPIYRLIIILATVVLVVAVWGMLNWTNIGLIIRAGTRDSDMVRALGIDVRRMFTIVFMVGTGLAGFAGALVLPIMSLSPTMGNGILINTFVVVVVGGLGSLFGTLVSGFAIGQVMIFSSAIPVLRQFSTTAIFVFMGLVLLIRPRGLFGEVGLYED